jgi:transcriptional regulator with XRE-family HTH domain
MKEQTDLRNILKKGILSDELDLERAFILDRKLCLLVKEYPNLKEDRAKLRLIIKSYEKLHWLNAAGITDDKVNESDEAEYIAEQERVFLEIRKTHIKQQLIKCKLTQQDLGKILGHGKSYMSELMNGVCPFSNRDLIILHRLFQIKLEYLIPTILSQKDRIKLSASLNNLNKPELKGIDFVKMILNPAQNFIL